MEIGEKIGAYEVIAKVGAGGMGEVYRARDVRLGRDVAIKILSPRIAADRDAITRFEREARALAALNHPNIAAIYGVEEGSGQPALILELVDGETLADRIARGPVPVGDAIRFAQQIADALDTAHEAGIVHRDLKPGNIKITEDGRVKVLDFGLAKAIAVAAGELPDLDPANSPTITVHGTQHGVILGTAAYMSPEQARGKRIDKRTDIWAFGCVLFEMLTGKRAFSGETTSDVIAAIIERPPDLNQLPRSTPGHIRRIVERCLEKDPKRRARDIADIRLAFDDLPAPPSPTRSWMPIAVLVVAIAAIAGVAAYLGARTPSSADVTPVEFTFAVANAANPLEARTVPSPDGRRLAFAAAREAGGEPMIWIRNLQSATPMALAGTEGVAGQMFWSPDGRHLGFRAGGRLKRVPVDGGPVQVICPLTVHLGATWGKDDVIVIAPANRDGLFRVSATGGELVPVTKIDTNAENSHRWPHFLPDGRHFIFTVRTGRGINNALRVGALDSPDTSLLVESQSNAEYAAGHLLYVKDGALMAHPFDAATLTLHGSPRAVAGPVLQNTSSANAAFSASADGRVLVFVAGSQPLSRLVWFDRSGRPLSVVGADRPFLSVVLSHDETRALFDAIDPAQGTHDLWTIDLAGGVITRLTNHPATDWHGVWSPDDREIAFASDRAGQSTIFRIAADGSGEPQLVYRGDIGVFPQEWLPDGRLLFLRDVVSTDPQPLLSVRLGASTTPEVVTTVGSVRVNAATTSPDGRLVAYTSTLDEPEVMAVEPSSNRRFRISDGSGIKPVWRRDGRELFFETLQGDLMAAAVSTGPHFGPPVRLMRLCQATTPASRPIVGTANPPAVAVSRDGQRVLAICRNVETDTNVTVSLGWQLRLQ